MIIPKNFEEKKLICEFMGCEVYEAYRSPTRIDYTVRGQMVVDFRNAGLQPFGFEQSMMFENLKFDESWDWLMHVWKELKDKTLKFHSILSFSLVDQKWYHEINKALFTIDLQNAFLNLVEGIKWFNENNQGNV